MSDERKPCIYKIKNKENGKVYIGKASYPNSRFRNHKSKLNRGVHENPHLQNAWNKYGEESFSFQIILLCEYSDMPFYEENLIKSYGTLDSDKGYNMVEEFGSNRVMPEEAKKKMRGPRPSISGKNNPMYGIERSDEVKDAIREAQKGREHSEEEIRKRVESLPDYSGENNPMYGVTGEDHPRYGKEHSEEAKRKLSEAHKGKEGMKGEDNPQSNLSYSEVKKIKELLVEGLSHSDIAKIIGCGKSHVGQIRRGELWGHVNVEGDIESDDDRYSNPGSEHPNSVINEEEAKDIKQKALSGEYLLKEIASEYDVSIALVSSIKRGDSWTHISLEGEEENEN